MKRITTIFSLLLLFTIAADAQTYVYWGINPDGSAVSINTDNCVITVHGDSSYTNTAPIMFGEATRVEVFKNQVVAYGPVIDFREDGSTYEYEMIVAVVCLTKKCRKAQDPGLACLHCGNIRTWTPASYKE